MREDDGISRRHRRMVEEVAMEVAETARWTGRSTLSGAVQRALEEVPRHRFVPEALAGAAYANHALPIGHNQTISQPYMVAIMTELLELNPGHRVLEIGTGSGYQAAILSRLARHVYSIEAIPALADQARDRLAALGCGNVTVRLGDGWMGWPEEAPFDRIICTAAPDILPPALVEQLRPGGVLILPIGPPGGMAQSLRLYTKDGQGLVHGRDILSVSFVPMVKPNFGSPSD